MPVSLNVYPGDSEEGEEAPEVREDGAGDYAADLSVQGVDLSGSLGIASASALRPKAETARARLDDRFVPCVDIQSASI